MRRGFPTAAKILRVGAAALFIAAISLSFAVRAHAGNVTYIYDDMNRLIQEVYDDGTVINHAYDSAGNRLSREVTGGGSGITLISPNGGEQWQPGSLQTIYWSYQPGAGTTVEIQLMKSGISNVVISSSTSIGTGGSGSLTWTVPANQAPGSDYQIKITSKSNPALSAISAGNFTIDASPAVTVTTPAGGENWAAGSTQTINWTYSGDPGSTVRIDLLLGGVLQSTPAAAVPVGNGGKGSFSWPIATNQQPGSNYQIKITSLADGQSSTSNLFTVSGGIGLTSPNGGEQLQAGTTCTINWKYSGNPGPTVNIDLLESNAVQSNIATGIPIGGNGWGSYSWAIPAGQAAGSDYQVRVTCAANTTYAGTSAGPFTIAPSSITINSPNATQNVQAGTACNISWQYAGNPGSSVKIDLLEAGALKYNITPSFPIGNNGSGSYSWAVPGGQAAGSDYQVRITSNTSSTFTATSSDFTIAPSSITVSYPSGTGNQFQAGYPIPIVWSYTGSPDSSVRIDLLNGGAVIGAITPATSIGSNGWGSYDWTIPAGQAAGSNYQVRVTGATNSAFTSTGYPFTVTPTGIGIVSPNGWEVLKQGSTATISWTYTGRMSGAVKIELLNNNSVSQVIAPLVSIGNSGSGSFSWAIPSNIAVGNEYKVRITSIYNSLYTCTSANPFTIGPTQIILASPSGEDQLQAGGSWAISWSYTGNPGSLVKIELLNGEVVAETITSSASIGSGGQGSYKWAIPFAQAAGSNFRIRVTSTSQPSCAGTSFSPFTIVPPVYVLDFGGDIQAGATCKIIWNYSGNPGPYVNIDLLKSNTFQYNIASGVPIGGYGSGDYIWAIPAAQAAGSDYRIRVTSTSNPKYTGTNDPFTINPSSITVNAPTSGIQLQAGSTFKISWSYAGNPGSSVKIDLLNGPEVVRTITSSTPIGGFGWGSYNWAIPADQAGGSNYEIRITSTSNSAYSSTSSSPFSINPTSISVTWPGGGQKIQAGTNFTISWNYAGAPGNSVEIRLLNGGTLVQNIVSSTPLGAYGAGSYNWSVPGGLAGGAAYSICATSTSNSAYTSTTQPFTIIPSSISVNTPWAPPAGTTCIVRWNYAGNPGSSVRIDLLLNGQFQYTIASAPIGGNGQGSYNWAVPVRQAAGSDYSFSLASSGGFTAVSNSFQIQPTALILTDPANGGNWKAGTPLQVCWSYSGNPGSSVTIELYNNGAPNGVIAASAPIGANGYGCYTWQIPSTQAAGTNYRIKIMSTMDNAYSDMGKSDFTITAP